LISRPFLLVPGFYNLTYDYVSQGTFPTLTTKYCGATPSLANMTALSGNSTGTGRNTTIAMSGALNTNTVAAFMSSAQLVSTPISNATLNATTSFTNPDTTYVPIDTINLTNYTASATSGLLDICGYSAGWITRSANFEIPKTAYYWLSFSTEMAGAASYGGAEIDDVRLTALGSPSMSSPPSAAMTVPVASPQTSSHTTFNGFSIVSDPLTFPAPEQ
jgi:hypothetical protein